MENLTGRQFGAYTIIAPLGEGGMAAVYRAYQASVDRTVALKVLPRRFADDSQFQARFEREARVVAQLQHPHILPVFDFGESEGFIYFAMPFVAGGTLSRRLDGTPVPLARVLDIMKQVCDALEYAHSKGVIHRDIKPSNILIDERNNCLVADFGVAKLLESNSQLTTAGGMVGTPAYMAPEQAMGEAVTHRCDIYSLSIVLYEMMTGRVPYKAETPMAVVIKHAQGQVPTPRTFNAALPVALERVMLRGLARNPEDRYATCMDLYRALETASRMLTDASIEEETDPLPVTVRDPTPRPAPPPAQTTVKRPPRKDSDGGAAVRTKASAAPLGDMLLQREPPTISRREAEARSMGRFTSGALAAAAIVAIAAAVWWTSRSDMLTPTTAEPTRTAAPAVTTAPPAAVDRETPIPAPATSTQPLETPLTSAPNAAVAPPVSNPRLVSSSSVPPLPPIQPAPSPRVTIPATSTSPSATRTTTSVSISTSTSAPSTTAPPSVSAPTVVSLPPSVNAPPSVSAPRSVTTTSTSTPASTPSSAPVNAPAVGGGSPRKIKNVLPVYPEDAVAAKVEGTVTLQVAVSAAGKVIDAKVLRSIPLLDAAAIAAVRQWEYEPTITQAGGESLPIPVTLIVTVTFQLK